MANAMTAVKVSSNAAITLTEIRFSTMLIDSQDSRRRERSPKGMLRNSSPPTIPWDFRWSSAARSASASSTCPRSTTPSNVPVSSVTGNDKTSASSRHASTVTRSASALMAVAGVIRSLMAIDGGAATRFRVRTTPISRPSEFTT